MDTGKGFTFEVTALDGEFVVDLRASSYAEACLQLKEQHPELTGWYCDNPEGTP